MSLKLSCWISLYKWPYECDRDQLMDRWSVRIWLWIINYDQPSLYPQRAELQQNIDVQPFDVIYSGCVLGPGRSFISCTITRQLSMLKYPSLFCSEISSLIRFWGSKCKSKGISSSKSSGSLKPVSSFLSLIRNVSILKPASLALEICILKSQFGAHLKFHNNFYQNLTNLYLDGKLVALWNKI